MIRILVMLVSISFFVGCSHNSTKISEKNTGEPSGGRSSDTGEMLPPKPTKKVLMPIDAAVVQKVKPLFEAIAKNDDKKAKIAYGKAVHSIPETVQLAVDLRFKNYEHALTILPKTSLSDAQKSFWQKVIEKKPKKLSQVVCESLMENTDYPNTSEKISPEEEAFFAQFESVAQSTVSDEKKAKEKSPLSESLDKITNCNAGSSCGPLSDDLQKEILADSFFDQLHNMKRRDTHYWQAHYKNLQTMGEYSPYVTDTEIYKFYRALKATTANPNQHHYLRRFRGVARDMRTETILSRSIADIVLEDQDDKILAARLGSFLRNNALISAVTRIEGEIPGCHAPAVKSSASAPEASPEATATATASPTP